MVRVRRKLGTFDLVASISSIKWKTVAPVENEKGQRSGQGLRFPGTDGRAADRVTEGL